MIVLSGCSTLGYYAHVSKGQLGLMSKRRPIAAMVEDRRIDDGLRARLGEVLDAREFASQRLHLPRNRSYTRFVALKRPFVSWSVFAAPEFSVEPLTHCFPFAGCVAYRGYFRLEKAERQAARLRERGFETDVEGVAAYSTLGWFADPVFSSMLRWGQDELIGIVFHELTHQKVYLRDDSAFNESLAMFVQQQGLREWRRTRGLPPATAEDERRERSFVARVLALRERLASIYAQPWDPERMRRAKAEAIAAFRADYARMREDVLAGFARYDDWAAEPINNAKLVPFGLYDGWLPAFAALFAECGGDWRRFHARVAALARLPKAQREAALAAAMQAPREPAAEAGTR